MSRNDTVCSNCGVYSATSRCYDCGLIVCAKCYPAEMTIHKYTCGLRAIVRSTSVDLADVSATASHLRTEVAHLRGLVMAMWPKYLKSTDHDQVPNHIKQFVFPSCDRMVALYQQGIAMTLSSSWPWPFTEAVTSTLGDESNGNVSQSETDSCPPDDPSVVESFTQHRHKNQRKQVAHKRSAHVDVGC